MTHKTFTIAGWLTMLSAFASVPMAYLAFKLEGQNDAVDTLILATMQAAGTFLFVAITLFLKKLLNRLYKFHDTDKSIDLMIMANIVAGLFIVGGMYISQIKETAGIAALVIMVFQGIVQIQLGYKLLRLQDNLGGLLKPFCYLNMATGVCVASIVLILVGVVVSAISDLMLATIFFNVSKQLKIVDQEHPQ
ncbi:MAG TPA: hypothetical protein VN642_05555 [Dongiaceae bacterium]|nr:hypothetical protein [Dongiaceae bacterium]